MTRVSVGARVHAGFQNLSLARDRLYGGIGLGIEHPRVVIEVEQADRLHCPDLLRGYAEQTLQVLDVPGATLSVENRYPSHVGLGSGTRLALATLVGIGSAYDRSPDVRALAPELGRGGRSGVGIATFLDGGFVVDGGHPTERFTARPPEPGNWSTPPVLAHHAVPESWRFVLITPEASQGQSGTDEDESMRSTVEGADPGIADEIAPLLTQHLLPAIVEGDRRTFGEAITRLGRLNGAWYADEQGGVYRPPAGELIDEINRVPGVDGVGQSSWGPTVYALTGVDSVDSVREAATDILEEVGIEGEIQTTGPDNRGYELQEP